MVAIWSHLVLSRLCCLLDTLSLISSAAIGIYLTRAGTARTVVIGAACPRSMMRSAVWYAVYGRTLLLQCPLEACRLSTIRFVSQAPKVLYHSLTNQHKGDIRLLPLHTSSQQQGILCLCILSAGLHQAPDSFTRDRRVEDYELHKQLYKGKASLLYSAPVTPSGSHLKQKL